MVKTNAMRLLDKAKVEYSVIEYEVDENDLSGIHVANQLGQDPASIFKTLVLKGEKQGFFVCCIPVDKEVDLRKAARAIGDKKAAMIHVKELLPTTGYIRGGCSPIGMKKKFPTFIDETVILFDKVCVSAGVRGAQLCISPDALIEFTNAKTIDLTMD